MARDPTGPRGLRPPWSLRSTHNNNTTLSRPVFTTALEAEAAFYRALAEGAFEALMAVWSEEEEVVCVQPGGPRIVGLAAVREIWRQILADGARIRIEKAHRDDLCSFPAGQVVGNMKEETSVRQVMQDLMQEYIDTAERISPLINL